MPPDQLDVPALPILVPLGLLLMAVSAVLLHRREMLTVPRLAIAWTAGWYLVAVIGATLLPLHLAWGDGAGEPDLFRITLVPLATVRVRDFVLNTAMTVPLAALLYAVFGIRRRRRVVLVALLFSAGIELTQAILVLWFDGTRWADVNDVISNTSGALLGHLWFWTAMGTEPFRRVVERCSLARSAPVAPEAVG